MTVKVSANGHGEIFYSSGRLDASYGIASLSKLWGTVLLHNRIRTVAVRRKVSIDTLLDEKISAKVDYGSMIYSRMDPRPDLKPPDDPLVYRPFRQEKKRFCLPIEKGKSYRVRTLFEAALFESKNDAIQALVDHFFDDRDNIHYRAASTELAQKIGLENTKIGDSHGLCDGDNVSSARDLIKLCVFILHDGHMEFLDKFNPTEKEHTARPLFENPQLLKKNIKIILAKTATGNNRQGNDTANSLLAIAKIHDHFRIAITLTDDEKFSSVVDMLLKG